MEKHPREFDVDLRVTATHDWVARDGKVWIFVLMWLSSEGRPRQGFPVLAREGDAP